MKFAFLFSLISLVSSGQVLAADPAHALRQTAQEVVFHYGVVPAAVVLAHPDKHPEREMHRGAAPKGASHLVVALFDAAKGERIADAEVTATVTLLGGASATPMNARPPLEARVPESELARFAAIARIAAAKGWGRYAERLGLGRHGDVAAGEATRSDAVRLREALEELGSTLKSGRL